MVVNIKINGRALQVPEGTTILEAAKTVHVDIPHLCYLKDLNEIGACRVCIVEVEGMDKLIPACNNVVSEGMEIYTDSPRVRTARRTNVQLILSQHNARCAECTRSGNCSLQKLANDLGILTTPFHQDLPSNEWDQTFPLIREPQKCIKCMRCVQVCDKIQTLNVWDLSKTGSRTTVDCSGNKTIRDATCSVCGQCITHCPVGALHERDDTDKVRDALADKGKIVIASIAPAVRSSWGEVLGLTHGVRAEANMRRLSAILHAMGFNYVFDTDFSADLTIMEEANEFLHRIGKDVGIESSTKLPMFTSCCPGWVRFMKLEYPQLLPQLSSAKSPQQMFGAIVKSWYAEILGVKPEDIYHVSIMPCTAKKYECDVEALNANESADKGVKDVDVVLTVRELDRLIRSEHIDVKAIQEEPLDQPLGIGTGAGVIFGTTGGVMEAALRTAYCVLTGKKPETFDIFKDLRGYKGWKEATFDIAGTTLKIAVAHGLGNARALCEALLAGEVHYDFVEVMACPTGCGGGGGQPIKDGFELGADRGGILRGIDERCELRYSHENPSIIKCYEDFLGKPLSEKAHHLLHTDQAAWKL